MYSNYHDVLLCFWSENRKTRRFDSDKLQFYNTGSISEANFRTRVFGGLFAVVMSKGNKNNLAVHEFCRPPFLAH